MIKRLTAYGYKPDSLSRLLFIVALVVCQFGLVLHQADIEHHDNGKQCTICLVAQGLDHALATIFVPPTVQATVESPGTLPASLPVCRTQVRLVARSPPNLAQHS